MIASQLNCALFLSSPKQVLIMVFFIFSRWGFSLQSHDCGFHMLMHAEHWDGQAICNFQKEDIADIRKLFTYRWLSHKDNETNWKAKIL